MDLVTIGSSPKVRQIANLLGQEEYTYRFCIDQMILLSHSTASKTPSSLLTTNAGSFDLEYNYLTAPLTHAKEGSATCIPFHLPPHHHHQRRGTSNEWKDRCTVGNALWLLPLPQPVLSCRLHRSLRDSVPHACRESDNKVSGGLESNSNNVQYTSTLNPFMTPPTGRP